MNERCLVLASPRNTPGPVALFDKHLRLPIPVADVVAPLPGVVPTIFADKVKRLLLHIRWHDLSPEPSLTRQPPRRVRLDELTRYWVLEYI